MPVEQHLRHGRNNNRFVAMDQPDVTPSRRMRAWSALTVAAATGASAVALTLPAAVAHAEPVPAPPPSPTVVAPPADPNAPAPAPVDPNAPPPPPADPNAPPADPNAPAPAPPPEPGRQFVASGGFSYLLPAGWTVGDAARLNYGQALLTKETGPAVNGQPAPVATDTSVLLGRLDLKLFAGAEPDNTAAAQRLASDMGEFFMPYPGTRINQATVPLNANGLTGAASYYEVKFSDPNKPDGQIWAGVVGNAGVNAPRGQRNERWFVVWLGTAKNPVDQAAAAALANSIQPWAPPPPPPPPAAAPPDPNAPPPDPNAPPPAPGRAPVGVAVPVPTPVPEMMPPG